VGTFHHFRRDEQPFIRVTDDAGTTWRGSEAEFERDYGVEVPDVAADLTERLYERGGATR
jgi:hypothetical protein